MYHKCENFFHFLEVVFRSLKITAHLTNFLWYLVLKPVTLQWEVRRPWFSVKLCMTLLFKKN